MRPLTMLGVGAVTALLLVACGSDSDQLSEEEFLAAANVRQSCQPVSRPVFARGPPRAPVQRRATHR